ncbi:MAG: hemerythrin domain-containing protein [Actinomycetota bacterium]|nr:hemerythrin domain-containing protein [Actinomycetota bacterium]
MNESAPTTRGDALVGELRWVHDLIRRDLATVRRMAEQIPAGLSAPEIQAGIESLAANGPLWQLRVNCLHYCRFVHSHHSLESQAWFPALRAADPAMNPVVDKLEADHENVAGLLDEVDGAAAQLAACDSPEQRDRLVAALNQLAADLLAHLDYEEKHTAAILRTWSHWPFMEPR